MKNLHTKLIVLILMTLFISYGYSQNCPDGMVSFWKLNDASDVLFEDFADNHNASAENSVANEPNGKVDAAKYFDGTNIVIVDDHADFDFPANSSFSIELWMYYSEIVGDRSNNLIGKNDPYASGGYWALGIDNPSGKLYFDLRDAAGNIQSIETSSALTTNVWHHLVAVRNEATNQNILYLDGAVVGSPLTYDYPTDFSSTGDVNIGFLMRLGEPSYFFKGTLDEIAIYNKALTAAEISEHITKSSYGMTYCDGNSPSINSTPVETAIAGHEYYYTVHAIGLPTMSYSLVTSPAGMNINSSTGAITWTPASVNDNGSYVQIRANNGVAPADTQSFRIFVVEAPVCPSGLIGLWKLDETSGTTYTDYYTDHTIFATVAPTPTTGKINGGQLFDAATEMDIPDLENEFEWVQTSNFSFEFWAKTSSNATMVVLGRYREDIPKAANWWVGINNGLATFYMHENDTSVNGKEFEISGGPSLSNNQWHHIIAVREGSIQENRLYVDGIEVASVATDYDNSFKSDSVTEINMGWFDYTFTGYHFVGALDEVAIFNKAITDTEAASFYNLGSPAGHCAVGNYPLVITSTPVESAEVDVTYTYNFTVEDYDVNDVITLSATTKPAWLNFNYTSGQKSAVLSGTPVQANKGDHEVVLHATDGTAELDQTFTITVSGPEGLEDLEAAGIRIYPVPAQRYLTVEFGMLTQETRLELINAAGSVIKKLVVPANQTNYTIDLSNVDAGAYYLHITNSVLNNIGRFVITK